MPHSCASCGRDRCVQISAALRRRVCAFIRILPLRLARRVQSATKTSRKISSAFAKWRRSVGSAAGVAEVPACQPVFCRLSLAAACRRRIDVCACLLMQPGEALFADANTGGHGAACAAAACCVLPPVAAATSTAAACLRARRLAGPRSGARRARRYCGSAAAVSAAQCFCARYSPGILQSFRTCAVLMHCHAGIDGAGGKRCPFSPPRWQPLS